jgi:hypothetical protein
LKPHHFHPEAAEEYAAAAQYYAKIQPELGGRFYDEIERLIDFICRQPDCSGFSMHLHAGTSRRSSPLR